VDDEPEQGADAQNLAERLRAIATDAAPPDQLAGRIRQSVAARRTHRRRLVAAAVAVAAVLGVSAGIELTRQAGGPPARPAPSTPIPSGLAGTAEPVAQHLRPGPAPTRTTLAALFAGRTPQRVPRRLADGRPFRAFLVTPAGSMVGLDQSFDPDGMDRWTNTVVLDPRHGAQRVLPNVELASFASDGRYLTTLAHAMPRHKFDIQCRDLARGTSRQVSNGSVWESSVRADDGRIAWTYYGGLGDGIDELQVAVADGCGSERRLPVRGFVTALRGRYLYVAQFEEGRLVRYDLATGTVQAVPLGTLPRTAASWVASAGPTTVLWTSLNDAGQPGELRARDLATGRDVRIGPAPAVQPGINGTSVTLTAGDRLLAYAASPIDGPPGDSRGLVYDPQTNSAVRLPGEAFVAGRWLVWLQDDAYWMLDVS
jgi:hypothetical protein